jgi:hypothetical protein
LGIDGRFRRHRGDFVGVVAQNASGSKIDWFLHRSLRYEVLDRGTRHEAVARVVLRNDAPGSGLPDYVIGNLLQPPLPMGTTKLYISVYSPRDLVGATFGGRPISMEADEELGLHVFSTYVILPPGTAGEFDLRLGSLPSETSRDVEIHRQPLATPDHLLVRYNGATLIGEGAVDADFHVAAGAP